MRISIRLIKYFRFRLQLQNALLDLLGGTDGPIDFKPVSTKQTVNTNTMSNATSNNQDLLDLLGGLDLSNPTVNSNDNTNNGNNLFSMPAPLSTSISSPQSQLITGGLFDDLSVQLSHTTGLKLTALDKNGISVVLVPQKISGCLQVLMTATNSSLTTLEQFLFQAAVPKSFTLQMLSPSGSMLPPGGTITQEMRLTCSAKVSFVSLKLRARVGPVSYNQFWMSLTLFFFFYKYRQFFACDFAFHTAAMGIVC